MFNFPFLNDKIDQNTNLAKYRMAFFDIAVNFIIQKLKSKPLVLMF